MNQEIDIPPFFLCPISLQIMKDPVTVSTGITYDRESIEKWLFSGKNNTCPVTKQPLLLLLTDLILTPNHTLRRLIQSWCTINTSNGVERIPTPKPPVTKTTIEKLLKSVSDSDSPQFLIQSLKKLKSIASESESNRRCIESASSSLDFLASLVIANTNTNSSSSSLSSSPSSSSSSSSSSTDDDDLDHFVFRTGAEDEALAILHALHLSEQGLKTLLKNEEFVNSLIKIMQKGNYDSRTYAVLLLNSMFEFSDPTKLMNLGSEFFFELVQLLKDQISPKVSKATLQTLIQIVPWGRNRIRAVEAGCVRVLVEILLDCKERKPCEMMLVLLEILCQCADGRAEILSHAAGLAIVSKKILRVSTMANDRAVRILSSVSRFSAAPWVVQEMLQLGVVAKLCLVLQVDSGNKAKEKAREILKLHAKTWRNSHCIPSNLLASYPTSG